MTESSAAFLSPPQTWHRDRYRLALVGAEAAKHRDLVGRAGYVVVVAGDGHEASAIFHETEPFDVVVLDFALKGRPPEAVLLFSRRTSPGAPCIALVASDDAEQFRRAFLAGARDVLPVPARGEDLLSSIDTVLEPRALGELVDGLKHEMSRGTRGEAVRAPGSANAGVRVIVDERAKEEASALRQQALDAFAERDRAVQARASGQKKVTSLRRQIKERDQRLALMERACEELTGKLKALRDERRTFEARALEAERRIALLETALLQPGSVLLESASTNPGVPRFGAPRTAPSPMPSDPDAEARLFESDDHQRIAPPRSAQGKGTFARGHEQSDEDTISVRFKGGPARSAAGEELEHVFQSYVESERRIAELRDELDQGSAPAASDIDFVDAEDVLSARALDERRLEELEATLEHRAALEKRVKELEGELLHVEGLKARIGELELTLAARHAVAENERDSKRPPDQRAALRRIDELEALLTERDGKISALESMRTLEKQDHRRQLDAAQSALISERESHAEARGILDAIRMERDSLRRRVVELEREAAEALTRVEELTPLLTDMERMRAELRAEKSQHHVTRRALTEAAGRSPVAAAVDVGAPGADTDVRR